MKVSGIRINISNALLQVAYNHIYDDNRFAAEGINTHYIVLAYKINAVDSLEVATGQQHSEIRLSPKIELLIRSEVGQNTKKHSINI